MKKSIKILMYHGRAAGHNIIPFIEYFDKRMDIELIFCYSKDKKIETKNKNVRFLKIQFSKLISLIKQLNSGVDIIWFHGGHSLIIFLIFILLKPKKSIFIFNVWNEWILKKSLRNNLTGILYRYAIKKADVVHCNWYGTFNLILENKLNENVKVFFWGLHREYFLESYDKMTLESKIFLESLPKDKTLFFFPKSISRNSRHDLIIEASNKLVKRNIKDFKVILWIGNSVDDKLLEQLQSTIAKYDLKEYVDFYFHDFVPFKDMKIIWQRMDCGLQIADNEQLSTTFTEPLFFKKEIIVSDIEPYRIFNEKFQSKINLVELNSDSIASNMQLIIKGSRTNNNLLNHRSNIIAQNFNLDKNINHIVEHYENQVNLFSNNDKVF